jgi:hypothetical protein
MTGSDWKERRDQVERYRVLERETTEPLAALLLHGIVLELEADLKYTLERHSRQLADTKRKGQRY